MASEDVLEMAEHCAGLLREDGWDDPSRCIEALAAEVRELRKDRARLDYLLDYFKRDPRFPRWMHHRDLIDAAIRDAAMSREG